MSSNQPPAAGRLPIIILGVIALAVGVLTILPSLDRAGRPAGEQPSSSTPAAGASKPGIAASPRAEGTGASVAQTDGVKVVNVTDSSFTVAWLTKEPTLGQVSYGPDARLGKTAHDRRGPTTTSQMHFVVITGLFPNTTYYFDVVSGQAVDNRGGAHYQARTAPTIDQPNIDTVYGYAFKPGRAPASGALVYLKLRKAGGQGAESLELATVADEKGAWLIDLPPRLPDLGKYFPYQQQGDEVVLTVDAAPGLRFSFTFDTAVTINGPKAGPLSLVPPGS